MATQLELMQEAYRRGILPADKVPLYEEAMRRGLVPEVSVSASAASDSISPASMSTPASSSEKPNNSSGILSALGGGARAALEGLGDVGALPLGLVAAGLNEVNAALGGSPTYFGTGNIGKTVSDIAGLPESSGVGAGAIRGATSVLPTLGAGVAMQGAKVAPLVAEMLAAFPKLQVASGAAGGAAAQAAEEAGAGPVGQAGAALLGGALPLAAAPLTRAGVNYIKGISGTLDRFSDAGQKRAAGDVLRQFSVDPDAVMKRFADGDGVLVPGSNPTMAQLSGDRGLAILEKGLANTGIEGQGSAIGEQYLAQRAARQDALNELMAPVQSRVADDVKAMAPGWDRGAADAGGRLRKSFDAAYDAVRKQTRAAYQGIDPDNATSFDLRPLQAAFDDVLGPGEMQKLPSGVAALQKEITNKIKNGENVSYATLQNIRSRLSSAEKVAAKAGDANGSRIAGGMKRAVDDYLENTAMNPELQGAVPEVMPGSANFRQAQAAARDVVDADAFRDDLAWIVKSGGLNKEQVAKLIGKEGAEDLNKLQPGLVRPNGPLYPDTVAADLDSFQGLVTTSGGGTYHADADEFLNVLRDRLSGGMERGKRNAIAKQREEILAEGVTRPHTGFTPEQAERFQEAKRLRAQQGENFERGVNADLARAGDGINGGRIENSAIPAAYMRSPESVEAFFRAVGQDDVARQALTDYAIGDLLKGLNADTGAVRGAAAWLAKNRPQLAAMGDPSRFPLDMPDVLPAVENLAAQQQAIDKIAKLDKAGNWALQKARGAYPDIDKAGLRFSDAERAQYDALLADTQRAERATQAAGVAGSPTAQLQRIEQDVENLLSRLPGKASSLPAQVLWSLLDGLTGKAKSNIYRHLTYAAQNPAYALELMRGANLASRNPWYRLAARPSVRAWDTFKATSGPQGVNALRGIMRGLQGQEAR